MTAHEKELLKRFGWPLGILALVLLVWWYYYTRNANLNAVILPNTSQSGVPVYAAGGGGGGSDSIGTPVNSNPAPGPNDQVLPINSQTPQTVAVIPPSYGYNGNLDPGSADLSRLTSNFPPAFAPKGSSVPNAMGSDCGCGGGCGQPQCNNGTATRFSDSSNTIIAASPWAQVKSDSVIEPAIANTITGLMNSIDAFNPFGPRGPFLGPGNNGAVQLGDGSVYINGSNFTVPGGVSASDYQVPLGPSF